MIPKYMIDDCELGRAIKVKMLMFGSLAEKVGAREIEVALEEGTTALQLAERFQLADMMETGLRVAIDGIMISNLESTLNDAAEVAFLPPVSGG